MRVVLYTDARQPELSMRTLVQWPGESDQAFQQRLDEMISFLRSCGYRVWR